MRWVVLVAALALPACVTEEQRQAQLIEDMAFGEQVCQKAGIGKRHARFSECVLSYAQYADAKRTRDREDFSNRMAAASAAFQQMEMQSRPRMQTTTCSPLGRTVHCTTF